MVQLLLLLLGLGFLTASDEASSVVLLLGWCVLGTVYGSVVAIALGLRRHWKPARRPTRFELNPVTHLFSLVAAILASLVGVGAALQHVFLDPSDEFGPLIDIIGVWAMILAWGLLHWGYAQSYHPLYYREDQPAMRFPETPVPGITDFVYFAFTIGTTFATSDVEVNSSRIRWRVVGHSILSFFFNGLIIVLALGIITGAGTR
ncbi:DUF1345 domain-containing protein [Agromyces sp. SYSU K20354]|uniref:DUF1345 domain-containing protein n=1 Tax=Agromyces cavernae TaxID=2898659 RepID=UPI001E42439F|nr:DUF1345 domain-containing protein [Agromyces cavernae]MCD2440843.1 DUF1345 domain-containing protein [Agromyces cavernae]